MHIRIFLNIYIPTVSLKSKLIQYIGNTFCEGFAQLGMLLANVERTCLLLTAIHVLLNDKSVVDAETFLLGYITGSKRRLEDLEYQRPGFRISGALTLAVQEASNRILAAPSPSFRLLVILLSTVINRKQIIKFNNSNQAEALSVKHRLFV